jgi:lysyl-tRNA synthetase class 2
VRTIRSLTVRQVVALGVTAMGASTVLGPDVGVDPARRPLLGRLHPATFPTAFRVVDLLMGLALLVLAPKLLRGIRTAVPLAVAALAAISLLHLMTPIGVAAASVALGLALVLAFGRGTFPLGSRNRPRGALVFAASGAWVVAYFAAVAAPGVSAHSRDIRHALHHVLRVSLGAPHLSGAWILLVEVLIGCAAAISLLALRSLLRPAADPSGHTDHEHRSAAAAVERHGEDSLSSFVLRPDKSFYFHEDGVLAYRVVGETAVVSGDPVAPADQLQSVLAGFREVARSRGWELVVWGASPRHLGAYDSLGLHTLVSGEEAFVDPSRFTLEGRAVRKLRQSVHRVKRRGWEIFALDGRELDDTTWAEVAALASAWRRSKQRVIGFAMGMGPYEPEVKPDDLYVLARSPEGELRAGMRLVSHCGKLSLDTMHRLEATPNGLSEALVCRALEVARERGIEEVSLNYAGLGHLAREGTGEGRKPRRVNRLVLRLLRSKFQLDRLVCFNDKFFPDWRPRYLVYESRAALPRAVLRVLQAEGYIPHVQPLRLRVPARARLLPRGLRAHEAR